MKIAIDCSKAVNEKAGIARYTWEIASLLPKLYKHDNFFYFANFISSKKEKTTIFKKIVNNNKNVISKQYSLPGQIKEKIFPSSFSLLNYLIKNYDIYHAVDFLSFDKSLKIPQVVTVHDLTVVLFPQHQGKKISDAHTKILKSACQNSDKIIAVSEATKQDIVKHFSILPEKITVTHLGYQERFKKISDQLTIKKTLSKYKINFPYILFVGTIEPRKNIKNLILAFDKLQDNQKLKNHHLVIIGRRGWNFSQIEETYQKSVNKEKIHFLNFVADEDLVYFYNGAKVFCYPSIYEGFGLPPLEAAACGVPVVTSNISSLPEVVGEAGELVNPNNYQEITNALEKILLSEKLQKEMSVKSLKQAKKFSWEKCARETHYVYKKVLDERKK